MRIFLAMRVVYGFLSGFTLSAGSGLGSGFFSVGVSGVGEEDSEDADDSEESEDFFDGVAGFVLSVL